MNDKNHDVHLLVEAFTRPKFGAKGRKMGEGKFAISNLLFLSVSSISPLSGLLCFSMVFFRTGDFGGDLDFVDKTSRNAYVLLILPQCICILSVLTVRKSDNTSGNYTYKFLGRR
jgi:hypothetical protein